MKPGVPLRAGPSPILNLSRDCAGQQRLHPRKIKAFDHEHVCKVGGVSRILGTNRHLKSGHHPPLTSPFLGPKPVFEINPRGVGLRQSRAAGRIRGLPERTR